MGRGRKFNAHRISAAHLPSRADDAHDAGLSHQLTRLRAVQHGIQQTGLEGIELGTWISQPREFDDRFAAQVQQSARREIQKREPARGDVLSELAWTDREPLLMELRE